MPLIVIEDSSTLEVRDCYLRSMRKDVPNNPSSGIMEEEVKGYDLEEIAFWVNGD